MVWSGVSCLFFKQKTAYEVRISDWSSDVCSSDLHVLGAMPDRHVDAEVAQARHVGALGLVAALHGIAEIVQDLGDPAHADAADADEGDGADIEQIGRASCRDRVCQSV